MARRSPYAGDRGVRAVLADLVRRHGWFEEREHAEGELIALRRGDASITLEPGAQLELSGAPLATIHETCGEFRGHMREIADISEKLGIAWLGLGFHPFAKREDLAFVPKLRYGVMREYLPTRGAFGLDMMLRTCTVQANLDYSSEEDAIRKLRVGLRLQPIVTAMFANSPFVEGVATGERSRRANVWLDVDNDRAGLLDFAWTESTHGLPALHRVGARRADVPREARGALRPQHGADVPHASSPTGWEGERANAEDWVAHVNSLFPEVRLKRTLEMRGADSLPTDLVCALPALWKGLLYEDHALDAAESLASKIQLEDAQGRAARDRDEGAARQARGPRGRRVGGRGASRRRGWPRASLEPQQERRGRAHPPRPPRSPRRQGSEPGGRDPREDRSRKAADPAGPGARPPLRAGRCLTSSRRSSASPAGSARGGG